MSTTDSAADRNRFTEWLADHPRLMGALFLVTYLLTQSGMAIANSAGTTNGP